MKPPRKIVTRSPHRRVGYVPCPWLQPTHVAYESLLECSFIRVALFFPHVQAIEHQPFRLDLGALGTYTPDYLLSCRALQNLVVEVKPAKFVAEHAEKLHEAQKVIEERGWNFYLCTEREICANDRDEQAGRILRHARSAISASLVNQLLARVESLTFPMSAGEMVEHLGVPLEQVMYLIGRRYLYLAPSLNMNHIYQSFDKEQTHGDLSSRAWFGGANW